MFNSSAIPCTVASQAPLSKGFPRQGYQSGLPFPFPGDHLSSGIEPMSPALAGRFLPLSHQGSPAINFGNKKTIIFADFTFFNFEGIQMHDTAILGFFFFLRKLQQLPKSHWKQGPLILRNIKGTTAANCLMLLLFIEIALQLLICQETSSPVAPTK